MRASRWSWLLLVPALPFLWWSGHVVGALPRFTGGLEVVPQRLNDVAVWLIVFWSATVASALGVGFVVALVARAVGHDVIRALVNQSQARLIGALSALVLWLALTGLVWSDYSGKSEIVIIVWYIATGLAFDLFNLLWLIVAARAAASLRAMQTAGALLGGAVGVFVGALGVSVLLSLMLNGTNPEPTLPLVGAFYFIGVAIFILPPAIAVAGGAAFCSALLGAGPGRSRPSSAGDDRAA